MNQLYYYLLPLKYLRVHGFIYEIFCVVFCVSKTLLLVRGFQCLATLCLLVGSINCSGYLHKLQLTRHLFFFCISFVVYKLTFKGDAFCVQVNSDRIDGHQCRRGTFCNATTTGECLTFLSLIVNMSPTSTQASSQKSDIYFNAL